MDALKLERPGKAVNFGNKARIFEMPHARGLSFSDPSAWSPYSGLE